MHMTLAEWLSKAGLEHNPWPVMGKGDAAKKDALTNATTGQTEGGTLFGEGQANQNAVLPFLKNEVVNPQGFGQSTTNAMTTDVGQATSGALSDATNRAKLLSARTGNTGGQSAIIGAAARDASKAQTGGNLDVQIANAKAKLAQQQSGAAGLEGMAGMDTSAGLNALGLSNESINAWSNANKSAGNLWSNAFLPLITEGEKAAGAAAGGGAFGGGGGG